jgi:RHS repeat-associated protein
MSCPDETVLCRYHYDPLDRLTACTPSAQARTQRFYLKERLTSEIQGSVQRSIFQQDDQLLAQQQRQNAAVETTLLATDQQRSVLHALDASQPHPLAYTPYGHRPAENGLLSLLGFNGERPDPVTGHYLLGNGYRAFNPVLMRFNSPDSWSPFGEGGLNAYGYCVGDPVNQSDPTGHIFNFLKPFLRSLGIIRKPASPTLKATRPLETLTPPIAFNDNYKLIGYHGTSAEYAQKMHLNSPRPEFDTNPSNSFGPGFYTTPDIHKAQGYADFHAPKLFGKNPDGMLAVYVKNPSTKQRNKHYRFEPQDRELVIQHEMYPDVMLVNFKRNGVAPEPKLEDIFNIRKRAHSTRTS